MKRTPMPGEVSRLLGGVKLAGARASRAQSDLERQVVRAAQHGCSLREIAKAGGFGSHHRVQEIVKRHTTGADATTGDNEPDE